MSKKTIFKSTAKNITTIQKPELTSELKAIVTQHSYLGQKGYTIPKSILPTEELSILYDELRLIPANETPNPGVSSPPPILVFKENPKKIYIPRFYGIKRYGLPVKSEIGGQVETINISFIKSLRDYQETVVSTYINKVKTPICAGTHSTQEGGGGILSLYTGAGKTVCAIKIISIIQRKTLIY